jgi:hypothetical protein
MLQTPVLFIVFNRPDTTQVVFDAIKKAQPKQLFIAADGPRKDKKDDLEKCNAVRAIIKEVDWECEVKTFFRDENLGCNKAVTGAISWFFEQVEEGIILEDDCLPHKDFWGYACELLNKYRDNTQVKIINGNNFQNGNKRGDASYYFSYLPSIWGWATWRRAWKEYDYDIMLHLNKAELNRMVETVYADKDARKYWLKYFNYIKEGRPIAWDSRVTLSIWKHRGLCIAPNTNLITNIGFGSEATHSMSNDSQFANMTSHPILPLLHPISIVRNEVADIFYYKNYQHNTLTPPNLRRKIEELIPWRIRKGISNKTRFLFGKKK